MKVSLGASIKKGGNTVNTKTGGWRIFRAEIDQDKCIDCGNCWIYCPDGVVAKKGKEYIIDYDFCKGCGICANECPVGAIKMELEEK